MKAVYVFAVAAIATVVQILPSQAETRRTGKQEFTTYCAPCHGVSGQGDGPVALELMKKPADLTMIAKRNKGVFDHDKVKKFIDGRSMPRAHGTPQMPIWGLWFSYQATAGGLLQEDQKAIDKQVNKRLENLVNYVEKIQRK